VWLKSGSNKTKGPKQYSWNLGAIKPKGLNSIAEIVLGHQYLREENQIIITWFRSVNYVDPVNPFLPYFGISFTFVELVPDPNMHEIFATEREAINNQPLYFIFQMVKQSEQRRKKKYGGPITGLVPGV
jgi:hypothetical protein